MFNRGRHIALAIAAAGLFVVGGCDFRKAETYRYRITVEVETPQGLRSGSSVWETSAWQGTGIPDRGIRSRERGEAVAVDLPGGTLFALLRGADMDVDYVSGVVPSHFRRHPEPGLQMGGDWAENRRSIAKAEPSFDLYPDEYPLLVRFRDIADPTSVERADPGSLSNLGTGFRVKRIRVDVTTDSAKPAIDDRLPWLKTHVGALKNPPRNTPFDEHPFASRLNDGDFVRGVR